MHVAIYVRVSTTSQVLKGTSLDSQITLCKKKAQELGYSNSQIIIYREAGFSGEDIDIRPEMTRLREDIKKGDIAKIIIQHPDRLSRELIDKLTVCREFEKYGVEIIFVDTEFQNTPEGWLFFNVMSAIATYELGLIKKRTVRGRLKAVEKGKKVMPMRVPPFGYELVNNQLIINEKEADVVQKIYHWYVYNQLTLREIGEKLYQMGVIPKRKEKKEWSASSIRRILTSEIYIGKYTYNKRKTQKVKGEKTATGNPKKTYTIRAEEDWIIIDVPKIVDESLFHSAQKQRNNNTKNSGNNKNQYLLKGLIKCQCGRTWEGTFYSGRKDKLTGEQQKYFIYRCPNRNPKSYGPKIKKCKTPSIKIEELEEYIWKLIVEVFSHPDSYYVYMEEGQTEFINQYEKELNIRLNKVKEIEKKREKLKMLFFEELISEQEMKSDFKKINEQISKLKEELQAFQDKINLENKKENTKKRMDQIIESIQNVLKDKTDNKLTFAEKRNIITQLIDEIHLEFDGEEQVNIKINGTLDTLVHDIVLSTQSLNDMSYKP
ncbi:TPA: recombinase family protein [Bacillus anthracis]|uniref:recombinase family protein n=1 Tax=Bacillus anthracis TaxID=1392 RepID=UPI0001DBF377|nr:recombinase family protein [Bacillus cereus]HDR4493321.1 recombinase family protein [Bacillus cereus biovar anthracis]ADK06920.1 DNA integration/recombination/invertion protein [Bacillus cereus biovar anthracis str. CI]HDR6225734.1 recombinase family protein [Bacillus cereus biovar anthracis]HDR6232085.1 recombinase family protein [Bacillus cereus biovar anthracis]HDR6236771.1 recombinase family protein [Bacillus cereus biovar anthracis]